MTLRVAVVGGGPAGVRAAHVLAAAGCRVCLIDEGRRTGGQIYRRPPEGHRRTARDLYGFEAGKATALHKAADDLLALIDYRPDTTVWGCDGRTLHLAGPTGLGEVAFDAAVLATGATDRVLPFPGWTLPGVFTLGGAQIALKAHDSFVGQRVVFAGTGPLLYLAAYQYRRKGCDVAAVLDTSRTAAALRQLHRLAAMPAVLAKGAYYVGRLRAWGVPVVDGMTALAALGTEGVRAISFKDRSGRTSELDADALAIGFGLKPEYQLAELLGCQIDYDPLYKQWFPEVCPAGRSSVPSVYLAGDGCRVGGADAAEISGRNAALAVLTDHGLADGRPKGRSLKRHLVFQRGLAHTFPSPADWMPSLADDVVLCRCEEISVGDVRRAASGAFDAIEVNRAKALSRVGMGRCQGRMCGFAAADVVAAARQVSAEAVGRLRVQAPIKPLPISLAIAFTNE